MLIRPDLAWLPTALSAVATLTVLDGSLAASRTKSRPRPVASGWVQAVGEVRVYPRRVDLGKLGGGVCVSGIMSRGRTMPVSFRNRFVIVYGDLLDSRAFESTRLGSESVGLQNYCGSTKVLLIEKLVLARPPAKAARIGSTTPPSR